jgi:hypothetical protein
MARCPNELVPVGCRDGHWHYDRTQHRVCDGLLDEVSNEWRRRVRVTHFAVMFTGAERALRGGSVKHGECVDCLSAGLAEPVPGHSCVGLRHHFNAKSSTVTLHCKCSRRAVIDAHRSSLMRGPRTLARFASGPK